MELDQETVYGTHEDSHVVMSEKVQSLAGSVYQEFEKMIGKYDEDVVKDLMPLVVNVLECLDLSYTENQEHEVELELLREDNEQLVTQYEREKQLRKGTEQKLLELEDMVEEDRKDTTSKVESLESIVRMLELKSKNSSDHVYRLEEKEQEMKKEYSKLHERYTELFKTHMDYMERTKILMGTDRLEQMGMARHRLSSGSMGGGMGSGGLMGRSSGPVSFGFSSLETAPLKSMGGSPVDFSSITSPSLENSQSNTSLKNELRETQVSTETMESAKLGRETKDKGQLTDTIPKETRATATSMEGGWVDGLSPNSPEFSGSPPELEEVEELTSSSTSVGPSAQGRSKKQKEQRSGNTLYQELSFQDSDVLGEVDEGADITGGWVHPGEYSSSDSDEDQEAELRPVSVNDNFFGMGKEVENLIMENNELLATKNALNIVKDDLIAKVDELTSEQEILREEIKSLQAVKSRMRLRIQELEEDLKRLKEEVEKGSKNNKSDDEEDVPMAQRKRFTRVEMARVLMERNQYKERFMELQEAVRWTEMIRASRIDPTLDKKSKQSIWKFFSNLFSTSDKPQRKPLPLNMRYNAPTHHVRPALDTMRKRSLAEHKRGLDFLDGDVSSEKLQQRRANERREQFRQVRAHVRKDDGRMQAYGWSLPAKGSVSSGPSEGRVGGGGAALSHVPVPVPVPVYCRPLMEKEPGMRIWCAAGVNLTGGRTRDGGSIVGASIFYSNPDEDRENQEMSNDEVDKLDKELKEGDKVRREGEELEQQLSSLVWICTSTHSISKVTIIDANNPADVLESFRVCSSHLLCIASVPGAKENDYPVDEELNKLVVEESNRESVVAEESKSEEQENNNNDSNKEKEKEKEEPKIGSISFVSCVTGGSSRSPSPVPESPEKEPEEVKPVLRKETVNIEEQEQVEHLSDTVDSAPPRRLLREPEGMVKDGLLEIPRDNEHVYVEVEKMSSVLATMWLGSQSGAIYVHSAVSQWKRCLHSIKLKDSVLSIVHLRGRVLAALADGTVAIFHRATDGQWDLTNYHLLDLGRPYHSIRCMVVVHSKVWCGYRNRIHVVDPRTMSVEKSFDAHPRKESQVRQMAWLGDGVWVSIRLDSTLRLFHAHTHQHLQDVDIEPYVSKMLAVTAPPPPPHLDMDDSLPESFSSRPYPFSSAPGMIGDTWTCMKRYNPALYMHLTCWHLLKKPRTGKLGFSFVRITGLLISSNRLWIGTGNGVIISVPLSESAGSRSLCPPSPSSSSPSHLALPATSTPQPSHPAPPAPRVPGSVVRVYSDGQDKVTPGSFIPFCSMAQAQLSFHGHRDAVKFFVAVPGSGGMSNIGIGGGGIGGGEGTMGEDYGAGIKRKPKSMLVMSGGEGYIDFRIGDGEEEDEDEETEMETGEEEEAKPRSLSKGDRSHLVVWQVSLPDI